MDISILLNNTRVNIRTAVLIETEKGYIFEKDGLDRFYFVVGGRIKTNETSEEAVKREVKEELGIEIEDIKLKAIVESFFELDNEAFHEIGFYYYHKVNGIINLPENYYIFSKEELKTKNIQPKIIQDIIKIKNKEIKHIILSE